VIKPECPDSRECLSGFRFQILTFWSDPPEGYSLAIMINVRQNTELVCPERVNMFFAGQRLPTSFYSPVMLAEATRLAVRAESKAVTSPVCPFTLKIPCRSKAPELSRSLQQTEGNLSHRGCTPLKLAVGSLP